MCACAIIGLGEISGSGLETAGSAKQAHERTFVSGKFIQEVFILCARLITSATCKTYAHKYEQWHCHNFYFTVSSAFRISLCIY